MRIACPNCSASYEVPAALLTKRRTVRCARCQQDWHPATTEAGIDQEAALAAAMPFPAAPSAPASATTSVPAAAEPSADALPTAAPRPAAPSQAAPRVPALHATHTVERAEPTAMQRLARNPAQGSGRMDLRLGWAG